MNTKGIKFLAVLAVLVMAFAAIAVVAPAETDDAGEAPTKAYKSPGSDELDTAAVVGTLSDTTVLKYYAATDISIQATGSNANYIVYVLNATPNVALTITSVSAGTTVQVIPVTVSATDATQLVASSGITLKISSATSAVFTPTGAKTATLSGTATVSAMEVPAGTTLNSTATLTVGGASKVYGTLGLAGTTTINAAITNTGTIAITGNYLVTLNNANAKITATETSHGKITTSGEKAKGQLKITTGEISYQDITLKGSTSVGNEEAMTVGGSGTAKLISNNIIQASAYAVYIDYASGTATIVSDNVFTTTTNNLSYSIGMGENVSTTVGSSTQITVTGNDFSGIPQSKYEDAYHTPVKITGSAGIVTTEATNGKVFVDKTGMRLCLRGNTTTIEGDLTPAYLALASGTSATLKASKTLTLNNDTYVKASTTFVVEALAIVNNNANLYVNGTMTVTGGVAGSAVGTNGIIGTGTTYVMTGGTLNLGLAGADSSGSMLTSQDTVVYAGGELYNVAGSNIAVVGKATTNTALIYDASDSATTHYVKAQHASDWATSGKMIYTVYGNYTVNDASLFRLLSTNNDATVLADSVITVKASGIFYVPANGSVTLEKGASLFIGESAELQNNGVINYATYDQVLVTTGSGTFTVDGETETVSTASSQAEIDAATTSVIIATEIASITVPEGKVVVTTSTGTLATVTIAKAGSVLTFTSTDATKEVTVKNGTDATVTGYGSAVFAVNGTVTVSYGSVKIDGEDVYGTITDITGKLTIEGDLAADQTLTLIASADTTLLVEDGSTLTIPTTSTLVLQSSSGAKISMNNDGAIVGGGTIEVGLYSQFYTAKPVSVFLTGDGEIITDDSMETLKLSDKLASSMVTNPTQKVLVTGNLTIKDGQYLVITGELEIPEGVTVTIEEGGLLMLKNPTAYAYIHGTIKAIGESNNTDAAYNDKPAFTVDSSVTEDVYITGEVIAAKGTSDDVTSVEIKGMTIVDGVITINAKAAADFGNVYISDEGALTLNGTMSGTVYNEGYVTINGKINGAATINMWAAGATVDVQALKSAGLTITDSGMYLLTVDGEKKTVDGTYSVANSLELKNVGGIKVVEDIYYYTYDGERKASNLTYLSGTAGFGDSKVSVIPQIIVKTGTVSVADALDIAKAQLIANASLYVTGTITVENTEVYKLADDNTFSCAITINANYTDVLGLIAVTGDSLSTASESHMNAVKYEKRVDLKNVYYYTTLKAAIDSGEKDFEVLGTLNIYEDTTIPAGINVDASGKTVNVGHVTYGPDAVLTVANGGNLTAGTINVIGTMDIKNTDTGINCSNIISDTSNIGETDALYTNIYYALNSAVSGDEVKITSKNGIVYLARDVTVPEGVTLIIPSSKELGILVGATLTVDGEMKAQGAVNAYVYNSTTKTYDAASFAEKAGTGDDAAAAIEVNGFIESSTNMTYAKYKIPGAYYTYKTRFFITSLPNSALVINDADARTIDVYGDNMAYGEVAYEGTLNAPVIININDSVSSGTITVEYGTVNLAVNTDGEGYDMKIAGANGIVTLAGVKVTTKAVFDATEDDDGNEYIALTAGVFAINSDSTLSKSSKKMTFDGEFGISGSTIYRPTFKGDIEMAKTVNIVEAATVSGTLYVYNEATVAAGSTLTVTGSVVVAEATTSKSAGKMTVSGNIYVGASSSVLVTSDAASISGDVKGSKAYFVFDGAEGYGKITEYIQALIDTKQYTEFYVEDELLMTVYDSTGSVEYATYHEAAGSVSSYMTYLYYPKELEDCVFVAWQYLSSGAYYDIAKTVKVGDASGYNAVYANIDYNIYDVVIYTDAGVKAVSIDGIELYNYNTNQFMLPGGVQLMAGTHTVTYTMKAGYSGTPTLKTVDGTILKDYKFITTGTEDDDLQVYLQLSGTEPTPEPEPTPTPTPEKESEWNVTTILLLVLVILIAIMAVIVALRLNRN